jgi:hypothetical protein
MSHFKEVCPFCGAVLSQCDCDTNGEKPTIWKVCEFCIRAGCNPGLLPCEKGAPADTSDAQAFRNLCRDVYRIFDIPQSTPLPKAMGRMVEWKKLYQEKDAGYSHLMAVCEAALGKDGPFEATDAATRIEKLLEEHKAFAADIVRWEGLYKKLETDLEFWRKECGQAREERSKARDDNATLQQHLRNLYRFFSLSDLEPFDVGVQRMKEQVIALQKGRAKLREDLDEEKAECAWHKDRYTQLHNACKDVLGVSVETTLEELTVLLWKFKEGHIQALEEHKTLKNTCEVYEHTVRKLREDLAKAKDPNGFYSNPNGFLAELRNALSEPTCDLTHLLNRVKGEVEVNRTVRGKLQAALGLKDEEVSSHYDLADDVCDRVGRYESLQSALCSALHLDTNSDDALVRQVERLQVFRQHVCTLLGTAPAPDSYILKVLAEKIQGKPAPGASGEFWKPGGPLWQVALPRTWKAGWTVPPMHIKRGMVFRTHRRLAVIGFYLDGETKTVLVEDADKRDDILERWELGVLAQAPLAEDFTEVV